MPLLSVIVPIYNVEPYLSECLDSLQNQTLEDMEIICINDGSTDRSCAILDKYASQYPNKIIAITQENKGISAARNAGMVKARGAFITFCDSDDSLYPQAYETALSCFTDDINSVCFGTEIFYEIQNISGEDLKTLKKIMN